MSKVNAHDVLREEKKKQSVRVVSEENLKKLEAAPLTTESLFGEFQPIVSVVIDFPDGSERLVKVRRINNAEAFSGIGVYAFIQDDGKIDESSMTEDEKIQLDIKIKRQLVVAGMEDPHFKFGQTEGNGYPVESLGGAYLNLFFDAVNEVNNPKQVRDFLRNFRQTNSDETGKASNVNAGEEGGAVCAEAESDDTSSSTGVAVSVTCNGT